MLTIKLCFELKRLISLVLLIILLTVTAGCASSSAKGNFRFNHQGDDLVGDLVLPAGVGPHPVVMFIHGDGAMPADGFGYYQPLMDALVSVGFATLSWDKPGVNRSKGNWLKQSMQDRADEAIAIARNLKLRADIDKQHVGLWGISQAGWVMPLAVSQSSEFAFMVSVSGAINWLRQSEYLTRSRMQLEGNSEAQINEAIEFGEKADALLVSDASYEEYLVLHRGAPKCCRKPMQKPRWEFVRLNIDVDATVGLRKVKLPVLALFGDNDLNVDSKESARVYRQVLNEAQNKDVTITVFENADHSLYPSKKPRLRGSDIADMWQVIKVDLMGAGAFVPGYIEGTVDWLLDRYSNQ